MDRLVATFSLPPSSNHIYRTGRDGKRYLTKEARAYRKEVRQLLMGKSCPSPPFNFGLHFKFPNWRRRDLSNQIKLLEDSIFGHFGHDDTHNHGLHIWKYIDRKEPGVTVEITHSTRNIDITIG